MKRYGTRSQIPTAFLTEIIIVILFFALSAATVLSLFSRAAKISDRAEEQNLAMFAAASCAEDLRTARDMEAALLACYPAIEKQGDVYTLLLDEEMLPNAQGEYRMAVRLSGDKTDAGTLQKAEIEILSPDGAQLYALTAAGYLPQEVQP